MSDYDNPQKVKRKEIIVRIEDRERVADIGFVMSSPQGRRVMNDLLKRCGVGRLSFAGPGQAEQTAFYEGQRNIGNYYWAMLTKNFKKEWLIMTDEFEKKQEAHHGRDNDSGSTQNGRKTDTHDGGGDTSNA